MTDRLAAARRIPKAAAGRAADRLAAALAPRLAAELATPPAAEPAAPEFDPFAREARDNEHLMLLIGFLLREDDDCIDIGANRGRFLSEMVRRAPHGRHIAWEPLPQLAAELRTAFPQVEVHEAALAAEAGRTEFVVVPEDLGYSGLRERSYPGEFRTERIEVAIERLDDALPEGYAPALIKVDVEGAERGVFEGGLETIARHKPVIVFEHGLGGSDRYGTDSDHIFDLLVDQAGLRLFDLDADGPLSRERLAERFASGTRWNFLARP